MGVGGCRSSCCVLLPWWQIHVYSNTLRKCLKTCNTALCFSVSHPKAASSSVVFLGIAKPESLRAAFQTHVWADPIAWLSEEGQDSCLATSLAEAPVLLSRPFPENRVQNTPTHLPLPAPGTVSICYDWVKQTSSANLLFVTFSMSVPRIRIQWSNGDQFLLHIYWNSSTHEAPGVLINNIGARQGEGGNKHPKFHHCGKDPILASREGLWACGDCGDKLRSFPQTGGCLSLMVVNHAVGSAQGILAVRWPFRRRSPMRNIVASCGTLWMQKLMWQ